ncbi:PepSY domain-containing protein [Caulobacter segnis]|uniref:Peptidase n=1 Tax=Caulobacter segnis TaxID=88688 RepID=A0A2W5VHV0_9CAUL|nr:PepSY domain-containing protein [Caulobacter segnis]PZR34905.1 MAG: peptidase [Caulobacter segnis]
MTRDIVRIWTLIHKWASLICTAFLLMLCLTGLPLVFHDEIDRALNHAPNIVATPGQRLLNDDQVLDIALRARPGEVPLFMSFDVDRPVINVTTGPRADAPESLMHFAPIDQTSGRIVAATGAGGVMDVVLRIHKDMFLGLPGLLFLGVMGALFVAAIVSGLVIYTPFMRKIDFGTVRASRSTRLKWLDYHNLLGVVTAAWVTVVGLTGVINTLSEPILAVWRADQLAAMTAPYKDKPPPIRRSSIAAAIATAQAAAPGMRVQFVAFPGGAFSSKHHYAVFLQGATPATKRLPTPALVDAETGRLTAIRRMPWYAQGLLLSQPLHFGDYGGLPLKILWALLDIVTIIVTASGLYLWLSKKKAA